MIKIGSSGLPFFLIGSESGFVFGNPIAPFVINVNFLLVGCKKIEIYVRASAETNTFSAHNANIKGKMIGDVKFELSTCIYM